MRLVALRVNVGAVVPLPLRETACGEPVALSVTLRVAFCTAALAGLMATRTVHSAPGAREAPHTFNSSKEEGFVPERAIEVGLTGPVPVLDTLTA